MAYREYTIEGRNAVLEALKSGKPIDKLYVLDGCQDGPVMTIKREAKKRDCFVKFVDKERLDQLSETGHHQGVIAMAAAYEYAELEDLFTAAKEKGEDPFFILLDNIEDPHNLGAIIRTANLAGAHGVIIPKNRAVGLTASVARTSAGSHKLYAGCESDQSGADHGGVKKERTVDGLCGHGRNEDVRPESEGPRRPCDRKRGRGRGTACEGKLRHDRFHSDERGYRFPERFRGGRRVGL